MTTDPNDAWKSGSRPRRPGLVSTLLAPDLAEEVASSMVHRLLSENPGLAAAAKADGSVTILAIHAREWVLPIRRAWITALFVEDGPDELSTWPLAAEAEDAEVKPQPPRWFGFARDDAPGGKVNHRASQEGLIDAFQSGKPVFGWSHNPDVLLPKELRRMADRVVQVPPPSPAAIAEAADVLAGAPPTGSIPEEVARATMPHHLLMAWRRHGR